MVAGPEFEIFKELGFVGLFVWIWWQDSRRYRELLDSYREDTRRAQAQYEASIRLVETAQNQNENYYQTTVLTTQVMQKLVDSIEGNRHCPMVRGDGGCKAAPQQNERTAGKYMNS